MCVSGVCVLVCMYAFVCIHACVYEFVCVGLSYFHSILETTLPTTKLFSILLDPTKHNYSGLNVYFHKIDTFLHFGYIPKHICLALSSDNKHLI